MIMYLFILLRAQTLLLLLQILNANHGVQEKKRFLMSCLVYFILKH